MAELNPVWENEIWIGTEATTADPPAWTYKKLCKGIESVSFTPNEQNQQYFFLCGQGFAHNETTGAAPELQVSGRRTGTVRDRTAYCRGRCAGLHLRQAVFPWQ